MPSFITGITGFAGGYLARHLLEKGAEVVGIGLSGAPGHAPCDIAGARVIDCDILDFDRLSALIKDFRPAFVYHLAGRVNPAESLKHPREYYLVNVQGIVNLLESLRQARLELRVLFVSSSEVYAAVGANELIDESASLSPENPYAWSKWLAEQVCRQYSQDFGARVVVARPFNHSGPGQSRDFVISDFCRAVAQWERESIGGRKASPITVGNLSPVRDFLDVRDVVRAYAGLAEQGAAGEVYNVCSGIGTSIADLLKIVLEQSGLSPDNLTTSAEKYRPIKNQRVVGANQKLCALLQWQPRYTLAQTIAGTLDHWRSHIKEVGPAP
ncbi:MAG: GDP-mannose 4,6-dehydratase [Acidobacteriota bacterium]